MGRADGELKGSANTTPVLGEKYPETCFHVPNQSGCFPGTYPMDPDNDENEAN